MTRLRVLFLGLVWIGVTGFTSIQVTLVDGSTRTFQRGDTLLTNWSSLPDTVVAVRFLPEEVVQFTGCDRYWAYTDLGLLVLGCRRPMLDVGTPNEVPEALTEIIFDLAGSVTLVRDVLVIPVAGTVKRWPY